MRRTSTSRRVGAFFGRRRVPDPPVAAVGALDKNPYGYLCRALTDVTGISYASSFSAEVAIDLPAEAFTGDFGEVIRHGDNQCAYVGNRKGWCIDFQTNGFSSASGALFHFMVNDGTGSGYAQGSSGGGYAGRLHLVLAWNNTTKTISGYVNGVQAFTPFTNTNVNASLISGELLLGTNNRYTGGYTGSSSGLYTNDVAAPEMRYYLARIWQKELSQAEVTALYNEWSPGGSARIPGAVSGTPVTTLTFNQQVGNVSGADGTGWVKDITGGNHMKIVEVGRVAGAPSQANYVPSGAVRIASPANGSSGVSGATVVRADGLFGSGSVAMQYYIEADTVPTFNSGNLRNSGWLLSDGLWRPGFDPSTTHYLRCKARTAASPGTESGWSATVSFTTRAPVEWYVRDAAAVGTYGSENGTSYLNAWNDFHWRGTSGGRAGRALFASVNQKSVAPGDTLWACGDFGLVTTASTAVSANNPQRRTFAMRGTASNPVKVRFDHAIYPAKLCHFFKFTGAHNWRNDGGGIYSTTTYPAAGQYILAIDDGGGRPGIDVDSPFDDVLSYDYTNTLIGPGYYISGGRQYVKMPDGLSPANKLWYCPGSFYAWQLLPVNSHYVTLQGGEWRGTLPAEEYIEHGSTYITLKDLRIKYSVARYCFYMGDGWDNWTLDNVKFGYGQNAVYGVNTGPNPATRRCADNLTIKNCWFHHIGEGIFWDQDSHAAGVQAGDGWVIEDNLFEFGGTAIELWGSTYKDQKNHIIRRNFIRGQTVRDTSGGGISFTNGGAELNRRTGCSVTHNVCVNTDGSGVQFSLGDPITVTGNICVNNGLNPDPDFDWSWDGISFRNVVSPQYVQATITDNVVKNPRDKFLNLRGAGLQNCTIDRNVFHDTGGAAEGNRFVVYGYNGGGGMSFNQYQSLTPYDDNGQYGDPLTASLPAGVDPLMVKFACAAILGDVDGSGTGPNASDLAYFDGYAAGNGARVAARRLLQNLITYGSY